MTDLSKAIEQLEQAVEKAEIATQDMNPVDNQQDLFSFGSNNDLNRLKTESQSANVHYLNPKDFEAKLNNVIGKMESMLEEG